MKTLQECKDEVSFEMFSVPYDKLLVLGSQLNVMEGAAKLFAQEACREQREICLDAFQNVTKGYNIPIRKIEDAIKNASEPKMI